MQSDILVPLHREYPVVDVRVLTVLTVIEVAYEPVSVDECVVYPADGDVSPVIFHRTHTVQRGCDNTIWPWVLNPCHGECLAAAADVVDLAFTRPGVELVYLPVVRICIRIRFAQITVSC